MRYPDDNSLDRKLIFLIVLSALISILTIWCAEPLMSSSLRNSHLWLKQLIWYLIGTLLILFINHLNPNRIYICFQFLYWLLMIFLFLLWIDRNIIDLPDTFIRSINGTTAWLQIPGFGSFQPSEFMKIILIVLSALQIDHHFKSLNISTTITDIHLFLKILKICFLPILLILMQPDTGIPIVLIFCLIILLITSPIQKHWIISLIITVILCTGFLLVFYHFWPETFQKIAGYRLRRISGWLNPVETMRDEGYQLYTSLLLFGSCGLLGCGIKQRIISIPEAHTDFIFTVIAQNFGLCGTLTVWLICVLLDIRLIRLLIQTPDSKQKKIGTGLAAMMIFQQIQNMCMVTGLLPITGIPLPLFSYGGSSILSTMLALSLFFRMSHHQNLSHKGRNKV